MSQNQNVPPPGAHIYTGEVIHSDQQPDLPAVPQSPTISGEAGPAWGIHSQQSPSVPVSPRDVPPPSLPPEPEPWTDEDYIRYASQCYGHQFTAPAARAFLEFDSSSSDVQAAEFYKFLDEHYEKHGYF